MLKDKKHVSEYKIGEFVINIKKALYAAYGKQYVDRRNNDVRPVDNQNPSNLNMHSNKIDSINSRLMAISNGYHTSQQINRDYAGDNKNTQLKWKLLDVFKQSMEAVFSNN